MWIPWATSSQDFPGHHIEIATDGGPTLYIWQAHMADGDGIRCSRDGWHDNNYFINGGLNNSGVDGNRVLTVALGGNISDVGLGPWPYVLKPDGTLPWPIRQI